MIPPHVAAIWDALSFSDPRPDALRRLSETDWDRALDFCDRNHLTTTLAARWGGELPLKISERLAANLSDNARRLSRFEEAYLEIAHAFGRIGVDWVVLKGFSHWPGIGSATRYRQQYDIDLFCPRQYVEPAHQALCDLGYQPLAGVNHLASDHLPTMVRPSGWKWRGDFFDVEIPCKIDLHHQLWDPSTELLAVSGLEQFWSRRVPAGRIDFRFPALAAPDLVGYASLHLLRHFLRGDLPPFHVYDLAWFLNSHADDHELWECWKKLHDASLRKSELVIFQLAREWFGCKVAPLIQMELGELAAPVQRWFELYAAAPLEAQFRPNKRELWLHLELVNQTSERWAIFTRRILPARLPSPAEETLDGVEFRDPKYWRKMIGRAWYHLKLLLPTCFEGLRWWWDLRGRERGDRALVHSHLRKSDAGNQLPKQETRCYTRQM
jgi:hypothetical protein